MREVPFMLTRRFGGRPGSGTREPAACAGGELTWKPHDARLLARPHGSPRQVLRDGILLHVGQAWSHWVTSSERRRGRWRSARSSRGAGGRWCRRPRRGRALGHRRDRALGEPGHPADAALIDEERSAGVDGAGADLVPGGPITSEGSQHSTSYGARVGSWQAASVIEPDRLMPMFAACSSPRERIAPEAHDPTGRAGPRRRDRR